MKKILVLLLCFNIVLTPTYVFANTSLGGWTITSQIAQGASTLLNASKTAIINGASVLKTSTAKITPNASQVAKVLRGGAYGYAISVAVEQILGKAVDWVLDPANNQIKYFDPTVLNPGPADEFDYGTPITSYPSVTYYSTKTLLLRAVETWINQNRPFPLDPTKTKCFFISDLNFQCTIQRTFDPPNTTFLYINETVLKRPKVIPVEQPEMKTLPLPTVAAQVISNAESHADQQKKTGAQSVTTTAAQDMLANDAATQSDVQNQLETNARTQTQEEAQGETKPSDPANPTAGNTIKLNFPVFCSWAPVVCEAAQVAISFPKTVSQWWTTATTAISASWTSFKEWLDWTKNDSELPENEINQVTELPIPELQENAISWAASCPSDVQVPINLYGQSSTLTFSWSPWCQLLNVIKPAIIASSYIGAAFIVLGLRT